MNFTNLKTTGAMILLMGAVSCANNATEPAAKDTDTAQVSISTDTAALKETEGEWVSLFDGKTLKGWHGFNKTGEIKNWTIEEGAMVCLGAAADAHGGDIVSDASYENFELKWEWKISKGGNSGVMYHVMEGPKYKSPYETGPEYQMIDDIDFPDKLEDWQKSGADYAMNTANEKKKLKPVGEWNTSKIVFNKGHVEHWLNDEKIIEFQAWDDKWNKERAEGKWKDYPDYGVAKKGMIALQDHGNKAYFKNIMIKVL